MQLNHTCRAYCSRNYKELAVWLVTLPLNMTMQEYGHLNDSTKEFLRSIMDAREQGGLLCYGKKTILNPIRDGALDIEDLEEL